MIKVSFIIDRPSYSAAAEGRLLTGFERSVLLEKCLRAGLFEHEIEVLSLDAIHRWTSCMAVTMGEKPLQILTGKTSIDKWHLSPLDFAGDGRRIVPTFDFKRIQAEWPLNLYLEMAIKRAAQNAVSAPWERKHENYILGPSLDEAIAHLESLAAHPPDWLSLDIETGRKQINTFGVAWSPNDALAVKVLPDNVPPVAFKKIWDTIGRLCESDVPKVMQNGIFERLCLSRYGIEVRNFKHDTMTAQKFLWPELTKGLDNVGRIYTMERYWKDDGRSALAEGKTKDWGNIRDWTRHFAYNARDTSNTLIAALAQREDLKQRGQLELYDNYWVKLFEPVAEMCLRGLPLNEAKQAALIAEYEAKSAELVKGLSQPINPRSPKAKLALLESKGYEVPRNRKTKKPSTDELSLKKLRLKYPDDTDLQRLLEIAGVEKALSSYLRVRTLPDKQIRFMLDPCSTETGRMSCSKDPWDGGFNAQTLTPYVKKMIEWPADSGREFLEIDLSQAESRFVAYDAEESTLLGMLERREDIHRFVAAEIYKKPMSQITHDERQLGKKSGHGANYSMGPGTFQESCLREMDLVLSRPMATRVLEAYHTLFPGIRQWHARIRSEVYAYRKLSTPLGHVRHFYGRPDDSMYREAYAYRPQATIPAVVNHLMLKLCDARLEGRFAFALNNQCHDSLLLSGARDQLLRVADFAAKPELWHPEIVLTAGRLVIPAESKVGRNLGSLQKLNLN